MAGESAERQENGFLAAVMNKVAESGGKPIRVTGIVGSIKNVQKAYKFTGITQMGNEPYTDVVLDTTSSKVNISMKGESAPSLAGGGLSGIELSLPGYGRKFMEAALNYHLKNGLLPGEKVPDVFARINEGDKRILVEGTSAMGGPVHYMYIGPMEVRVTSTSLDFTQVILNGKLIKADEYARDKDLWLRLRARRDDQTFDPKGKDNMGIPTVYGRSPSKGDSKGRIVVTDKKTAGIQGLVNI
jgi:hypothetical protein